MLEVAGVAPGSKMAAGSILRSYLPVVDCAEALRRAGLAGWSIESNRGATQ
jgi:hypothetical protein